MADDRALDGKLAATANNSSRVAARTERRLTDVVEVDGGVISIGLGYLNNTIIYAVVSSTTAAFNDDWLQDLLSADRSCFPS